jgi:hypothetical protein
MPLWTRCPVLLIEPNTLWATALSDLLGVPVCAVWHDGATDVLAQIRRWRPVAVVIRPWDDFGREQVDWLRGQVDVPVLEIATNGPVTEADHAKPDSSSGPVTVADVADALRHLISAGPDADRSADR